MKIIVFGARGEVGSRIVKEAMERGHEVTGVVRNAAQLSALPSGLYGRVADVAETMRIAELIAGHDVAISAIRPPDRPSQPGAV